MGSLLFRSLLVNGGRNASLSLVGGAGFRQLATFDHKRNRHFERVLAMYTKQRLPFELWLGRGSPLNPTLRGVIIYLLRREMKARELTLIPDDLLEVESIKEFLELTTRVRDLLRYCRWYYCTAIDPRVTIEEFFNAPVNNRKWKVDRTDSMLVRFGLLWKVYDLVAC